MLRDYRFLLAATLITSTVAGTFLLVDHNRMPAWGDADWFAMVMTHGSWDDARASAHISPLWLLIPTTLTIAFIIASAKRRAVRDAALLAAGEAE